jgi:hypothetical protein
LSCVCKKNAIGAKLNEDEEISTKQQQKNLKTRTKSFFLSCFVGAIDTYTLVAIANPNSQLLQTCWGEHLFIPCTWCITKAWILK